MKSTGSVVGLRELDAIKVDEEPTGIGQSLEVLREAFRKTSQCLDRVEDVASQVVREAKRDSGPRLLRKLTPASFKAVTG
jgi:hypothetical protein